MPRGRPKKAAQPKTNPEALTNGEKRDLIEIRSRVLAVYINMVNGEDLTYKDMYDMRVATDKLISLKGAKFDHD